MKTGKKILSVALALIMVLGIAAAGAPAFATGDGSSSNPYQIGTYSELKDFANTVNAGNTDACAVLTADIFATDVTWVPIGNDSRYFAGTFDGQGHTVTGLENYDNSADYVGLFGCVSIAGVISNVCLEDCDFKGQNYAGLVARNIGTITGCCFKGTVSVAEQYAGGIAGYSSGTITDCYNTGTVSAGSYAGGITGFNYNNGTVTNCYNTGSLGSDRYTGGIAGDSDGVVLNCYYDSTVCGVSGAVAGEDTDSAKGLTTAEMQGAEVLLSLVGFSSSVWTAREDDYPILKWEAPADDDNPDDPDAGLVWNETDGRYEISDYAGLRRFAAIVNGESVIEQNLSADAVLTADITAGSAVWKPIGNYYSGYKGTFDGNGHTVTGLTTAADYASDYVGFFGCVELQGTVCNLTVEGGRFTGFDYVGFAGINFGTISDCKCSAVIIAADRYAGGIAGENDGTVTECLSDATVSALEYIAGGIAGRNNKTIQNCYNTGTVSCNGAGGITGANLSNGSVKICCNTGFTGSGINSSGISGSNSGIISECYYDNNVCGVSGAVAGEDTDSAKGLTTAEMQGPDALLNLVGFSSSVWAVREDDYPVLRWLAPAENDNPDDPDAGLVWNEDGGVYEISDYAGLRRFAAIVNGESVIGQNRSANAILVADITAGSAVWKPIGTDEYGYMGTFDGNGHTITGLTTAADYASDYVGFFGSVGWQGTVCNLIIEGGVFRGCSHVGFAGSNYGTISNCSCSAEIIAADSYAGGIVGDNYGTITGCFSNATVSASLYNAGGIAGINNKTIQNCYNKGTVSADSFAGGIAGNTSRNGTVITCCNTGTVSSYYYCAGISCAGSDTITNSYYDKDVSGVSGALDGEDTESAKGLTTAEMQGPYALLNLAGFSSSVWTVRENDYPVLKWLAPADTDNPDDPDAGLVWNDAKERYEISDYAGLRRFAAIVNGESVIEQNLSADAVLVADITAGNEKWTPIGSEDSPYTGTFEGNGHTVTGITTGNDLASDCTGFFGCVGEEGKVSGLIIEDGTFPGGNYVGLAGVNNGSIERCTVSADVISNGNCTGGITGQNNGNTANCVFKGSVYAPGDYAGGIAGENNGTIANCGCSGSVTASGDCAGGIAGISYGTIRLCSNSGTVTSDDRCAGGIAGVNYKTVLNCYNKGAVSANDTAGGIAGQSVSSNSSITNCYNIGSVSSYTYTGNIIGSGYENNLINCFYDEAASGVSGAAAGEDTANARGLTTAQMTGTLNYLTGFAQAYCWTARADDYPALSWELDEISVGAHSLTLEGDIAVNFYIDLSNYTDSAYAQFTVDGETFTVPADFDAFASVGGNVLYKFTCNVAPVQIDSPITCSVYNGRIRSEEFTYSVNSYFDEITADETLSGDELLVKLAGSMACYGYFANLLFNYNPAYMFNDIALNVNDRLMTVSASDIDGCAEQMEDTADGVIYYGSSLLLRTRTAVRHYFTLPEGGGIDDFTFLFAGEDDTFELTPVASGNLYYIEIDNIPAPELGDFLEVYVTDGSGSVVNSWLYSAMSYARKALIKYEQDDISVSPALANAVKALVVYYECASDYFDANAPEGHSTDFYVFVDSVGWNAVFLYAWDENGNSLSGEFPGTAVTDVLYSDSEETVYRFELPEGTAGIILCNENFEVTEDITDFDCDGFGIYGNRDNMGHFKVVKVYN